MTKIGVNNLAVFFSGENLYTFDHFAERTRSGTFGNG